MKTLKLFSVLVLGSFLATACLTSCSDDRLADIAADSQMAPKSNLSKVQVIETGEVNFANSMTRSANIVEKGGVSKLFYQYKWATLRYEARTADGTKKMLSELLIWPTSAEGDFHPKTYIVGCHSTITSDAERPTNLKNQGYDYEANMFALFSNKLSQKALVVVPDYEGYGITSHLPHPYCNRELTAEQVVEGATQALEWFEANQQTMDPNWQSVAVGYSQGGAVAAGFYRYCLEHNRRDLRMKGAVCGDGPYAPLATLKQYIQDNKLYMPVAPTLLLKGAVDTNPEMKRLGCTYQDFVNEKFYETGIFQWLDGKQLSTTDIQKRLLQHSFEHGDEGGFTMMCATGSEFMPYTKSNAKDVRGKARRFNTANGKGMNFCATTEVLKPAVIEYFQTGKVTGDVPAAKLKALEQALAENDLTYGCFRPSAGFTFFHSTRDEVVPYCNYQEVSRTWGTNSIQGQIYNSGTCLHVNSGTVFFLKRCGAPVDDILKDKWQSGEKNIGNILY